MDPTAGLHRFLDAQDEAEPQGTVYEQALGEIRAGRKETHWMWFVFPQLRGLGRSETALYYGLASLDEARAYLADPVLGPRLRTCVQALTALQGLSAHEILGSPDDLKLHSSLTLFALAEGPGVFQDALARYFGGRRDAGTLRLLGAAPD